MADNKEWGQHVDKIAYGVAALIGLIVLAIPSLFSGQSRDAESDAQVEALVRRANEQDTSREFRTPERITDILAKQWNAGIVSPLDPHWSSELTPALLKKVPKPPEQAPVHKAGAIAEIRCERNAEKKVVYLQIKGQMSDENEFVIMKKVELLRQEGDGPPVVVPEFAPIGAKLGPKGNFEFSDYGVKPGLTYTYSLRSTAARDPKAEPRVSPRLEAPEQTSAPLGPTSMVPFDFSITILSLEEPKEVDQRPRFFGKLQYWDYKEGKAVDFQGGSPAFFTERDVFPKNPDYDVYQILVPSDKVTVRDVRRNTKFEFKKADSKVHRPVRCFEPLTPESKEEPPADGGADAGKAAVKGAPEKAKEKSATGKAAAAGSGSAPKKEAPKKETGKKEATKKESKKPKFDK